MGKSDFCSSALVLDHARWIHNCIRLDAGPESLDSANQPDW